MSDFIPSPYPPGSPEDIEMQRAQARGLGIAATSVLPSWLAQVSPYRVDDQGQGHWQLPGGLQAAYGAAGELIPMAYNFGTGQLGIKSRLPPAPGAEQALKNYAETKDMAFRTIPHMEPQSPDEQTMQDLAFGTAGMAVPGAGVVSGLARAIPFVGRAASAATHMSIPPVSTTNALVGAGLTSGAAILQQKEQDDAIRDLGVDPAKIRLAAQPAQQPAAPTDTDQWDLSAPDQSHVVTNPQSGAAAQIPFDTASTATNKPLFTINLSQQTVPEYGSTGEQDTDWGHFLAGVAGVVGLSWLVMKHGGLVLDPAWKVMTGQLDQLDTIANATIHNANLDAIDTGAKTSASGAPTYSSAARGEAPLPGKAGTVGTNLAQASWDSNRVLTELNNATMPKLVAEQLNAELGTTNGSSSLAGRIAEQMYTGVNEATNNVLPSPVDFLQRYDNLTPEQKAIWDKGMWSASELDYRNAEITKRSAPVRGGPPLPWLDEDVRTNYVSAHTNDLRANIAAMRADPATSTLADLAHQIVQTNWTEGVAQGRIKAADAASFVQTNPHYIPAMDLEGRPVSGVYDVSQPAGTGWQTPNTSVVDAIIGHYTKFYDGMGHNTLNDNLIRQYEQWIAADPARSRFLTPISDYREPLGEGTADGRRVVTVHREGTPYSYHVDNTAVFNALKNNRSQASIVLNGLDMFRRSMQSGTTGVAATIAAQRPFAAIGLLRNIPQIAVDKSPGVRFGWLDQALQDWTGGRVSNRIGLDPTQYIGSANAGLRGAAAMTARNIADILRNPANPVAKLTRVLAGDAWTNAAAQRMEQRYLTSDAAARRATGATGGGTGGLYEPRTFNVNVASRRGFNPMADVVPGVFHPDGLQIPFTKVGLPGSHGVVSSYINLRSLLRDINQEIYDGANSYLWKQNPQLSPAQRAFETRRTIGDPSMGGASSLARFAGQTIPYFNPSMQDTVRALRNFRDNPAGYVTGMMGTLVVANMASLLTAMLGGNDHLAVLEREITTHERASNISFFHNMQVAHDFTEINLSQRFRAPNAAVQELLATGIGAFQLRKGEDLYNRIVHSLADVFSHHISTATTSSMIQGASDFIDFIQPPQVVQTLLGMAGKTVNPVGGTIAQNIVNNRPLTEGIVGDVGAQSHIPGRMQSSYISKDDNGWMQRLAGNIMGIAGHAMYDSMSKLVRNYEVDHSPIAALDGLVGNAGQSWRDQAPFGNMLWGNNVKMNYRNPMEENFADAMQHMRTMPRAQDIYAQGFTRPGGLPTTQGQTNVSADPTIQTMLTTVNNYYSNLQGTIQPQINDLKKQLDDIDNDPHLDPTMIRRLHNAQVAKLNEVVEQGDLMVRQMNADLSYMAGKPVHVKSFNPAKGMEQFH